jgi:hypothetical protein
MARMLITDKNKNISPISGNPPLHPRGDGFSAILLIMERSRL